MKFHRTTYYIKWKEKSGTCKCIQEESVRYELKIRITEDQDPVTLRWRNYWRADFEPKNLKYFEKKPPNIHDNSPGLGYSTLEEAIESATENMEEFIKNNSK